MIGSGLELVRTGSGRNYELRRDGEVVGTIQRRGVLRSRYTASIGDDAWRFEKPMSRRMSIVDEGSGQEVARLEIVEDKFQLFLYDDARRAEPAPDLRHDSGAHTLYDAEDVPIVTLRHLGGRMQTIATIEPGERPWPSADPDAGVGLAVAVIAVRLVAQRDDHAAQEFSVPPPQ